MSVPGRRGRRTLRIRRSGRVLAGDIAVVCSVPAGQQFVLSRARRIGQYNEYLYTFFKCLAPDRLMYAEGWYAGEQGDEADIQLNDWIVQRRCPHLQGDLRRFGKTDGKTLTCTMHGWQFDLATGRCLVSEEPTHRLRSRPAGSPAAKAG